jgi:hypothetical protein
VDCPLSFAVMRGQESCPPQCRRVGQ